MNKRMRELQALILQKSTEAKGLMDGENKDIAKAEALMNEVDELQKEFETLERIEKAAKAGVPAEPAKAKEEEKPDVIKAFADAFRTRFKANMNETTPEDGGYTVPEDIQTRINEYKQQKFSLSSLIAHENVSTLSGRRTYKKRAQHTGFQQVAEGGKIQQVAAPQFEVLNYAIKKYAGYMPYTNELAADSDANIASMLIAWLGEEAVATENAQILAKINEKAATAMTSIDDIKKAVNVDLAAFAGTVRIFTNSDGLQYLDTLKDSNKRPLLSPDPVKPMEMYLSCGVRRIPVTVIPNDVLATADGKIPVIVGDLHEYVKMFDRQKLSLLTSNVAVAGEFNAYEMDMTLVRAIMRADWQVLDDTAIVRGELTTA